MPHMPTTDELLGPYGLTLFLLFVVLSAGGVLALAGKLVLDTYGKRIDKIEQALTDCHESHALLQKEHTDLNAKYGELKGKIEVLDLLNPLDIAQKIAEILKGSIS